MTHISVIRATVLGLALAAGLLSTTNRASAQEKASVTVPFSFTANHEQVAAGSYEVQRVSDRFLSLRNKETGATQTFLVRPETGAAIESRGRLVFWRQAGLTQLMEVWMAGASVHSKLPVKAKRIRELDKGAFQAATTFEVAMK